MSQVITIALGTRIFKRFLDFDFDANGQFVEKEKRISGVIVGKNHLLNTVTVFWNTGFLEKIPCENLS